MTATGNPPPLRPAVRLRPVPPLDPPFTDDPAASIWPAAAQLSLDLTGTVARRSRPPRRVDPTRPGGPRTDGSGPARLHLPAEALATAGPEAVRAAQRFLTTCLEILDGFRPVAQIRPLASPTAAQSVVEQLSGALTRLGRTPRRPAHARIRLRRLRVCEPRQGAAEAAAALQAPTGETWAVAFRLEQRRGTWVSTALRVL